ncbi:unnamed protein product [Prunus armeniaca]|uniref:Disease resistance protein At4g27190-like leucine-rich repeats domain-containing protein n=1 Tax=Prunus armeniaca TaxID=36596 RepID=A0A6J5TY45_PRUAR|nr:unnamed protein product [Prunus armeniaca]
MPAYLFENSLMLRGDVKEYLEIGAVRYFLKQSEDLVLFYTYNLKYVIEELDGQGGFQHLKVLSIMCDDNIEYLMNGMNWTPRGQPAFPILKSATFKNVHKLKFVCCGKLLDKRSFMNLRSIAINNCDELKYVFSLSVAQNLDKFPKINVFELHFLPKLRGFYTGNQRDSTYEILKPNEESVNKVKETRNDNQVAGSTSSRSKVAQVGASCTALFPSNCISWLTNLEELVVFDSSSIEKHESKDSLTSENGSEELVVNVVFDLEGHDSAFSQLQTFIYVELNICGRTFNLDSKVFKMLLVNLQHVHIYACENMETIVQAAASTEDNIHEEGKEIGGSGAMTLFPKLLINSFHLSDLPSLERFCPDAYSFAWSLLTRNMRCREESGGASSSTGSGCSPLVCFQSRPSTRNFTQILPQVVNREVTPTNLQTSSASDNLEHLEVHSVRFIGSDIFGSGNPFYSSI